MHLPSEARTQNIELPIEGMSCAACARRVEKALEQTEGVTHAAVNFATERATVSYDDKSVSAVAISEVIVNAGYRVPSEVLALKIGGMTCASCALRVESALGAVNGVTSARVNLATETAQVVALSGANLLPALVLATRAAGYSAEPFSGGPTQREKEDLAETTRARTEGRSILIAGLLTFPLVLPMLTAPFGLKIEIPALVQLALATPVQLVFGARFYVGAAKALRARTSNMDTLVALGTSCAFALSLVQMGHHSHLYFESAAVIITLVRFGKWLEQRAKRSTSEAIRSLMNLRPPVARVLRNDLEVELPADFVIQGDVVLVRPGERLPVDGKIIEGESQLDESLLTGESLPVVKQEGAQVIGGSINGDGFLRIVATEVGENSMLARVVALVQNAQGSKAPIERYVDRIAAVFVPVVLGVATLTLIGWLIADQPLESALLASVSVLVIACPCALGLATPAALTVGTGVAARSGILIKDAEALEKSRSIDTVVFDKTGTLTVGRPSVLKILAENPNEVLAVAAAVQVGSEHPVARAVRDAAKSRGEKAQIAALFVAHPGRGVEARLGDRTVFVGSPRFKHEHGHHSDAHVAEAESLEAQGMTVVWVFDEHAVLGAIGLGDEIRPGAVRAVNDLRRANIRVILLSGDNRAAAENVGKSLGIEEVIAEVLPAEKAHHIETLRRPGHTLAMVGDGVNDAPALATADVGFAMGTGSDVAMNTAGVTLMRAEPTLVGEAIRISAATSRKIRQNLFWAFFYNVVGIPLAAFGLLTPMLAGAAMALSSVSVLANALHLKTYKPAPLSDS